MECVAHDGICYTESMPLGKFNAIPDKEAEIARRLDAARPELQKMIDARMAGGKYTRYEIKQRCDENPMRSEQLFGLFVFFYYEATEDNPPPACDAAIG